MRSTDTACPGGAGVLTLQDGGSGGDSVSLQSGGRCKGHSHRFWSGSRTTVKVSISVPG